MLKILQLNTTVNTGSTGRIAEEIGKTMISKGWESYIAYGRTARESHSHIIRIGNDFDIFVHGLSTRFLDNHCLSSTRATHAFIKKLEKIKPDLIHIHNIHGYYVNMKVLFDYLRTTNIPIVWTLHDCWPMTGHCAHFDFINCNKWKTECHSCPNLRAYPSTFFIDRSRRNFNFKKNSITSCNNITFVTPSVWLQKIVKLSFLKNYRTLVINNGIDLSVFRPIKKDGIREKYGISEKDILILGVASVWSKHKGLDDFIKLSSLLDNDEKIMLVGLNSKQSEGLPSNIIAVSRTENIEELSALYSSADVFVNPTWVDNFPTTNIEALACGTPVVTYNTGGSPEALTPDTGFVVNKGDVTGIYRVIKEIIRKGKFSFVENCRQHAVANYNKDERFVDYYNLYMSILNS